MDFLNELNNLKQQLGGVLQGKLDQIKQAATPASYATRNFINQIPSKIGQGIQAVNNNPYNAAPAITKVGSQMLESMINSQKKLDMTDPQQAMNIGMMSGGLEEAEGPVGGGAVAGKALKPVVEELGQEAKPLIEDAGEIAKPITDKINLAKTYQQMLPSFQQAQSEIKTMADSVIEQFGGQLADPGVKSQDSWIRKAINDYGGDYTRITDSARNTIVHDNPEEVYKELSEQGKFGKVIKLDWKSNATHPSGYEGGNVRFQTSNRIPAEIQVLTPDMIFAKESTKDAKIILGDRYQEMLDKYGDIGGQGHKIYEQIRNIKDEYSREVIDLTKQSKAYYDKFISSNESPLITEAKKYKSAEEFVKKQKSMYHATPSGNLKSIESGGLKESSVGTQGKGYYFGFNEANAKSFVTDRLGKSNPNASVVEFKLSPNAKLLDMDYFNKSSNPLVQKIHALTQKLRDSGNLAYPDKANDAIRKLVLENGYDGLSNGGSPSVIYNKNAFQTKSQLTDIWNKANKLK